MSTINRRQALSGAAALTGLSLVSACGDDAPTATDPTTASSSSGGSSPSAGGSSSAAGGGSEGFAATSDVPVGGGAIFADEGVIVTQPEEGTFKGFKNACTHQGCPLQDVTETINCGCHNSVFDLDGAVVSGPATSPLAEQAIDVSGGEISLA